MTPNETALAVDVEALAQEIRRVDGSNILGAGQLAEALLPFLSSLPANAAPVTEEMVEAVAISFHDRISDDDSVAWEKQPGRYRTQTRKTVRNVLGCSAMVAQRILSTLDSGTGGEPVALPVGYVTLDHAGNIASRVCDTKEEAKRLLRPAHKVVPLYASPTTALVEPAPSLADRETAIGAAWDFVKDKLSVIKTEKGLCGVWTAGFRTGFDAATRSSPPSAHGELVVEARVWRDNVQAMLSNGDPDVVRCHEGGGPEDLIGSLVLTMMRTRNARDKASVPLPQPHRW